MRRIWLLWSVFGCCLALGLGAMVWISFTVVHLERAQALAAQRAHLEENVRLALWRMDSLLSPMLAQETARPYFAYSAFTPAERAYTRMFSEVSFGEVLVPSPLLGRDLPMIRLHFQYLPDGTLTSPQAPIGAMRALAIRHASREWVEEYSERLKAFESLISREQIVSQLPRDVVRLPAGPAATQPLHRGGGTQWGMGTGPRIAPAGSPETWQDSYQSLRSLNEFAVREQSTVQAGSFDATASRKQREKDSPLEQINEGIMRPLWVGQVLVLGRWVNVNGQEYLQGCWLDWPAIERTLLESCRDLVPAARLQPVQPEQGQRSRLLASIPVELVPGAVPELPRAERSPVRAMLWVAWVCAIVGSMALAALLYGAMSLSQRRAAFVSAVTHELRTPLTTVSMYAEMLEQGMLPDEAKRQQYLGTLRCEADRLGHLVENVLAYSRLERGRPASRVEKVSVRQLIEKSEPRLRSRAERAGLQLSVEIGEEAGQLQVPVDTSAVEQILFNLVDNAAKYAAAARDRRVHLRADSQVSHIAIRVSDHGPGIDRALARKLFRPFCKSAVDAANSAPGVGLGLALSRRLAREMRGDLSLASGTEGGACFVLKLPVTA